MKPIGVNPALSKMWFLPWMCLIGIAVIVWHEMDHGAGVIFGMLLTAGFMHLWTLYMVARGNLVVHIPSSTEETVDLGEPPPYYPHTLVKDESQNNESNQK